MTRSGSGPIQATITHGPPGLCDGQPGIDVSRLTVEKTLRPSRIRRLEDLVLGGTFTGRCYHYASKFSDELIICLSNGILSVADKPLELSLTSRSSWIPLPAFSATLSSASRE